MHACATELATQLETLELLASMTKPSAAAVANCRHELQSFEILHYKVLVSRIMIRSSFRHLLQIHRDATRVLSENADPSVEAIPMDLYTIDLR